MAVREFMVMEQMSKSDKKIVIGQRAGQAANPSVKGPKNFWLEIKAHSADHLHVLQLLHLKTTP